MAGGSNDRAKTTTNVTNDLMEAAEPRKRYGTSDLPDFASAGARGLHSAGDPEFYTDAQNNDDFYVFDTDISNMGED